MFTLDQLKAAHAKVKSGADFPAYVKEITVLGVTRYETYVSDGHTVFYGPENHSLQSPPKYALLAIEAKSNKEQFQKDLRAHQLGATDYPSFCRQAATHGIEKWITDTRHLTCSYFDKAGNSILVEKIPTIA